MRPPNPLRSNSSSALLFVPSALWLAACSSGPGWTGFLPETDSGTELRDAASSHDGNASGDHEDGGAMPAVDTRLLPLEPGRTWTFDVRSGPVCTSGMHVMEVLEEKPADTGRSFTMHNECGWEATYSLHGNVVDVYYPWRNSALTRMTDEPVEAGHTWTTTNGQVEFQQHYEAVPTFTSPAGTFHDCWKVVKETAYDETWTYCRGVGLVEASMADLNGDGFRATLVDKNF